MIKLENEQTTSAAAQSWRSGPRDMLRSIAASSKNKTTAKAKFFKEIQKNQEFIDIILEAWFKLNWSALTRKTVDPTKSERIPKETLVRVETRIKKNILNFTMPNGKALRNCTFGEVGTFGDAFSRIAKAGPADKKVGDVLTADEISEILA